MKTYEKYKDSGVAWLGKIPEHWKMRRLKNCIISREAGAWGIDEQNNENDIICLRVADFDYKNFSFKNNEKFTIRNYDTATIKKLLLANGDILIEKSGGGEKTPVGRAVIFDKNYRAVFANFMEKIRTRHDIFSKYFLYAWSALYENRYITRYIKQTTGIQNLDLTSFFVHENFPVPPLSEQEAIVKFLDHKVSRIEKLILIRQAQIVKLKELKKAVINKAVTRGLRDVPLKDSGVAWLGKIPASWKIEKLREIFTERSTKVSDKDYPALSVGYMGVVPQLETAAKTDNGDNRKLICKGDFAINSRSDRKGAGGISEYTGSASMIITVLKPHEDINGKFYHYLLRSHYFSEEFYRNGRGLVADLWSTNWNNMRNIFVPVPPLAEQNEITKYLDKKCGQIDKLITIREKQITELNELKARLISDVVTGKIDVR